MTVRDDVRRHFEREAVSYPVPPGLRATTTSAAHRRAHERRSHQSAVPGLVAALLALAIIGGLVAIGVSRSIVVPVEPPRPLFHDIFNAPVSGRPSLTDREDIVHVQSYVMVATLSGTTGDRNVYAIDRSLSPSPEALGRAFGLRDTPQLDGSSAYTIGHVHYFPDSGAVRVSTDEYASYSLPGKLAHSITSEEMVIPLAEAFLVADRLFTQGELDGMYASKRRVIAPTNPPLWFIEFDRTVGGLRDYGPSQPGALLEALDDGTLWNLQIMRHPIGGSMKAPVIAPAQAWAQVTMGHWYAADGLIDNGQVDIPSFRADAVELCYRESDATQVQAWLVPMWCFTDTTTFLGVPLRLYYPALTPGTFDWTVPNR